MAENIYEREKLYNEVWENPVTAVAKQYGVSDVAIHKVCNRMNIPVPPRGYWAKIRSGEKIKRTPLPAHKGPNLIRGAYGKEERLAEIDKKEKKTVLKFLDETERDKILDICNNIVVRDKLHNPHPLICDHIMERKLRDDREKFRQKHYGRLIMYKIEPDKSAILIRASIESINTAYLIMDAFIKTLEQLNCSVTADGPRNDNTLVLIRGEKIQIGMKESDGLTLFIDNYHAERKNFRNTKTKPLNAILGNVIIELFEISERIKIYREYQLIVDQRRIEEAEIRRRRALLKETELEKVNGLINNASDYKLASTIREYIIAKEQQLDIEQDEEKRREITDWITWAKNKADWIDPTIAREDDILGKRDYGRNEGKKVTIERIY